MLFGRARLYAAQVSRTSSDPKRVLNVTRRPATDRDTEFARQVHHLAYREPSEAQFGPWDEAAQDRFFESDWRDAQFEMVLANGEACGYVCIEDRLEDLHIREIVIHPAFQGRGIGSAILRDVIERARQRRVPVHLGTFRKNRAVALYQRLGFRETGTTDTHVLLKREAD